jgi:hypothetical protein
LEEDLLGWRVKEGPVAAEFGGWEEPWAERAIEVTALVTER